MSGTRNKRFPYLRDYVDATLESATREVVQSVPPVVYGVSAMGAMVLFASLAAAGAWLAALVGCGAFVGVSLSLGTALVRQRRLQNDPEARLRLEVSRFAGQLRQLSEQRKLHRWVDPVALQYLEASAYHWARIRSSLGGAQWSGPDVPAYWSALKRQAERAADTAMGELMLLCKGCVGPPRQDKESEIKSIVEDFVDLDIGDALQGLKRMASSDWTAYAHQSGQLAAVLPSVRTVSERLQSLADEIETKSAEFALTGLPAMGSRSVESIDVVLGELRAVAQAEKELGQDGTVENRLFQ
ncbi:MAG: hypothetical protein JST30_04650 [Armatimonadetes bacterium]|nr:hypothetical protein [Armatimonadota bacterium]